jgi:methylase of polypeptide subunit release factors
MPLDIAKARKHLVASSFKPLFIEELGWNRYATRLEVPVDGQVFELSAIAEKHGMIVFVCSAGPDGRIPGHQMRLKLERQVARSVHEHIIIFIDGKKSAQIWQWVRREQGKPTACREHIYQVGQPGDSLVQKLNALAISLEEEESITLLDVTGRARKAFDVERVTKRFYDLFKAEHATFLKFLQGIPDEEMERWYVSVMLNRLMFIYFIQKKGFLSGDQDYLKNKLSECRKKLGKDHYYRDFLCPLFFEGFAKKREDRSTKTEQFLGNVPYLNGGIFLLHQIEQLHGKNIRIADKAFDRLFDFFDAYQWHLDERPLRRDNEINPDVLGYIFEKYINQKQMGAYYTKEDITDYISKNTVIPFIFDSARAKRKVAFENPKGPTVWDLLRDDPDRYIYPAVRYGADKPLPANIAEGIDATEPNLIGRRKIWNKAAEAEYALPTETWREVVARRIRYEEVRGKLSSGEIHDINSLIALNIDIRQFAQDAVENCEDSDLLRAIWQAIERITILDPACGSGAFLFAALNILEPLYEGCLNRMEAFVEDLTLSAEKHRSEKYSDFRKVLERVQTHPNRRYFIFKSIILNNLFGVDIMEEAVEICKLRLFLKLAAQVEPDTMRDNSGIEPLPDIDFNIRAGNTLVGFATYDDVKRAVTSKLDFDDVMERISARAADLQQAFNAFRSLQVEGDGSVPLGQKRELLKHLARLQEELNGHLAGEYGAQPNKKDVYAMWLQTHEPFHWFVEFYGIVNNSGGFDVVIGNPPYVEYNKKNVDYRVRGYRTEPCANLFAFVWERSIALANHAGRIGFIIPVASVCTDGYATLRQEWLTTGQVFISNFNDRPAKLFDGLEHIRLSIVLLSKGKSKRGSVYSTDYNKWFAETREYLFQRLQFTDSTPLVTAGGMPKIGSIIEVAILAKVSSIRKSLGHFVSASGRNRLYYTRKLSWFVQILGFVPKILDESGRKREPSELKEVAVATAQQRNAFLCALNSNLFYWLLAVWSDCRNLNKREVLSFPLDLDILDAESLSELEKLADRLMDDFRKNSKLLKMNYEKWGTMRIQCIYPRASKHIIDEIDSVLASHYGFREEELDYIINYDIKYRLGQNIQLEGGKDDGLDLHASYDIGNHTGHAAEAAEDPE